MMTAWRMRMNRVSVQTEAWRVVFAPPTKGDQSWRDGDKQPRFMHALLAIRPKKSGLARAQHKGFGLA
jgi:hypothetical protein